METRIQTGTNRRWRNGSRTPLLGLLSLAIVGVCFTAGQAHGTDAEGWRQWGGPRADFKVEAVDLADSWPEDGPPQVWKRELGDGYSALAFDEGNLYTLYRKETNEVAVCLDAATGKTHWEHTYAAPIPEKFYKEFGTGPRSMPLVLGPRVYTVGVNGKLFCFDKTKGKVLWEKDLVEGMGGSKLGFGYANTPVPYGETIILPIGGEGHSIVALDQKTGSVVWKNQDFKNSYATPALIQVGGEDQLVAFMATHVIGVSPSDGTLKWSAPLENQWGTNCTTPVFGPDNLLFVTTEQTGSKLLRLDVKDGETEVKEVWFERKPQVVFTNAVRIDNHIYGAFGVKTAPFAALDLETGGFAWRNRSFNKASSVYADGKLILLDENGVLGLATPSPEGLEVHSKCQLFEKNSWTVPTLVGTKLYARDRKTLVALELGAVSKG